MSIDIFDKNESLIEKIMAHFGWYKVKKVEMIVENLEVKHIFTVKGVDDVPPFPVPKRKPALKKATTRKVSKNGN